VAQQLVRRTCDQAVVGWLPGGAAIKLPRSTQPSRAEYRPGWLRLRQLSGGR